MRIECRQICATALLAALLVTQVAVFVQIASDWLQPAPCTTETLLFTDRSLLDMTCAVALQSARFTNPRCVRVHALDASDTCRQLATLTGEPTIRCTATRQTNPGDATWGTVRYFALLTPRLVTLLELLSAPPPPTLRGYLMLDSDVALLRNVAARVERLGADLVFQRELPCALDEPCLNGGVWWIAAHSPGARAVVERALRYMHELDLPDQDALQEAVEHELAHGIHALDVRTLPSLTHPNGFVHAYDDRVRAPHLVHVNWTPSRAAKLTRLADLGVVRRFARCFAALNATSLVINATHAVRQRFRRASKLLLPLDVTHSVQVPCLRGTCEAAAQFHVAPCCTLPRTTLRALDCSTRRCAMRRSSALRALCAQSPSAALYTLTNDTLAPAELRSLLAVRAVRCGYLPSRT